VNRFDAGPPLVDVETVFVASEIWSLTNVGDTLYWWDPGVPGIYKLDGGELSLVLTIASPRFYADGEDLYAVIGDGEVVVAPEGGEPVPLITVPGAWFARPEDDRVYITVSDGLDSGRLLSVPKGGGEATEVVDWTEDVDWAGSDASYIYACGPGEAGIEMHRVPKTGGEFDPPLTGAGPGCVDDSIAAYYTRQVGALDHGVFRMPRDGGPAVLLGTYRENLRGLTVAGDYLYASAAAIHRMPIEGGAFVPVTASWPPFYLDGFLVGETRLYWVEFGSDEQGSNDVILSIPR